MDNIGENFKKRLVKKMPAKNASIFKRFFAFIIDIIAVNIIVFSPFSETLTGFLMNINITEIQKLPAHIYLAVFLISILVWLYFSLLQLFTQQTIGMIILKIRVTPKPSFFKALIRNIYVLPFFPFTLLWVIEPLYLYFKGERLLEKLTGTSTVENE